MLDHQYIGVSTSLGLTIRTWTRSTGGAVGQPRVDLEHDLAQPLELLHPQHRRAVRLQHPGGVQRLARRGGVPDGADVPLDAAGEPRVAQGEVRRLEDRVAVAAARGRSACAPATTADRRGRGGRWPAGRRSRARRPGARPAGGRGRSRPAPGTAAPSGPGRSRCCGASRRRPRRGRRPRAGRRGEQRRQRVDRTDLAPSAWSASRDAARSSTHREGSYFIVPAVTEPCSWRWKMM